MDSTLRWRMILLLGLCVLSVALWSGELLSGTGQGANLLGATDDGLLTVAFLDVGQGDAIFITTPDGVQLLIDGGADSSVLRALPSQMPIGDRTIDVVLATHPDKDHIGGLVDVLARYEVGHIVRTEIQNDTAVARAFEVAVGEEDATVWYARVGQGLTLGASTTLLIYSPASDTSNWESNASSIVAQLRYGEIEFMLTGDAPIGIEDYLARTYGTALESEVLKLGHHGSKTSSGEAFLRAVAPQFAVVSASLDNSYGHPHAEVIARVESQGIEVLSTAKQGTIVFKSDGVRVWVE